MLASQVIMVIMETMAGPGTDRVLLVIIAMEIVKEDARILVLMDVIILVAQDVELAVVIAVLEAALDSVMHLARLDA